MVNYQNGKVYKIINEKNEIIYIGSTVQGLSQRYTKHKHKAPNHKIILIENYSCNSKEELCKKEQEVIEQHSNLLNKYRAYNSEEDKKEYKKEYDKKWRENNKEEKKEHYKQYYEKNKDKINEKVKCEFCNCEISKQYLKTHQNNKKCLKFQNL
jgi:hypothetical protein